MNVDVVLQVKEVLMLEINPFHHTDKVQVGHHADPATFCQIEVFLNV
jgi:hypothetical protein